MRSKCLLVILFCIISTATFSQGKNYVLEINGDTVSVALNESVTFKDKNGKIISAKLSMKDKLHYVDSLMSFQYSSQYSVSSKKIDKDIEQIILLSPLGNGIMIQKYTSIDPSFIVDLMVSELTKESKDAGYKEQLAAVQQKIAGGVTLNGKESILTLDDEKNIYRVFPHKIKRGGMIIIEIQANTEHEEDQKLIQTFWETLAIKE